MFFGCLQKLFRRRNYFKRYKNGKFTYVYYVCKITKDVLAQIFNILYFVRLTIKRKFATRNILLAEYAVHFIPAYIRLIWLILAHSYSIPFWLINTTHEMSIISLTAARIERKTRINPNLNNQYTCHIWPNFGISNGKEAWTRENLLRFSKRARVLFCKEPIIKK
jgi:hypothetical protein